MEWFMVSIHGMPTTLAAKAAEILQYALSIYDDKIDLCLQLG